VHLAKNSTGILFFTERSSKVGFITHGSVTFTSVLKYRKDKRVSEAPSANFGGFWNYVVPKEFL